MRIGREDLLDSPEVWHRICSRHFINGTAAQFIDQGNPDWAPTLHLGPGALEPVNLIRYSAVSKWFDMLFPDVSYPSTRLSGALDRLEKKVQAVQREDGDIDSFLKTEVDFDFVSSSLSKVGLKRGQLLTEREWTRPDHLETLTHENVINIEQFRTKERQPDTFTCQWIKKLSPKHEASPDSLLKKSTKKLMETYRSLQLQKNAHQSQALSLFLIMPFDTVDKHTPLRSTSSSCCSETVPSTSSVTPQQKEIKQLSKANSVLQVNIKDLSEKVSVLKGALVDVSREKSRVTTDLDRATQQNADLQATIDVLQVKMEESQRKVHQMNPMHLNKLEKRLKTARADLRSAVTRQTVAERNLEKEKNTLQRTRVQTSKLKAAVIKTEWQNEELKQEVQELRQIVSATTVEGLKAELRAGEKNRYSDSVRKTVMALQADANVAASQCGKVISIVGQHLFNVDLKEEDLPKLQTCINIADEGHFLAKFQATETILAADNVTLHTDGTSRGAHKIVGQQITLDSGATLYLGLNTVATEDSETLLEVTIQMLQELSDVYAAEETNDRKEEVFNAFLTKLTSCMSDRAAVMKLFSTKLSDFLQSILGQEVTLHFLKCNAHFLLGLSRSCETSLKTLEEEMTEQLGRKLGRDTHQKFQRFRGNERATAQVVRLASSLLGPRGDEKNGCRAEWLAFLKNKSLLTSYRSGRCKNAAARRNRRKASTQQLTPAAGNAISCTYIMEQWKSRGFPKVSKRSTEVKQHGPNHTPTDKEGDAFLSIGTEPVLGEDRPSTAQTELENITIKTEPDDSDYESTSKAGSRTQRQLVVKLEPLDVEYERNTGEGRLSVANTRNAPIRTEPSISAEGKRRKSREKRMQFGQVRRKRQQKEYTVIKFETDEDVNSTREGGCNKDNCAVRWQGRSMNLGNPVVVLERLDDDLVSALMPDVEAKAEPVFFEDNFGKSSETDAGNTRKRKHAEGGDNDSPVSKRKDVEGEREGSHVENRREVEGEREGSHVEKSREVEGEREGSHVEKRREVEGESERSPVKKRREVDGESERSPVKKRREVEGESERSPVKKRREVEGERKGSPVKKRREVELLLRSGDQEAERVWVKTLSGEILRCLPVPCSTDQGPATRAAMVKKIQDTVHGDSFPTFSGYVPSGCTQRDKTSRNSVPQYQKVPLHLRDLKIAQIKKRKKPGDGVNSNEDELSSSEDDASIASEGEERVRTGLEPRHDELRMNIPEQSDNSLFPCQLILVHPEELYSSGQAHPSHSKTALVQESPPEGVEAAGLSAIPSEPPQGSEGSSGAAQCGEKAGGDAGVRGDRKQQGPQPRALSARSVLFPHCHCGFSSWFEREEVDLWRGVVGSRCMYVSMDNLGLLRFMDRNLFTFSHGGRLYVFLPEVAFRGLLPSPDGEDTLLLDLLKTPLIASELRPMSEQELEYVEQYLWLKVHLRQCKWFCQMVTPLGLHCLFQGLYHCTTHPRWFVPAHALFYQMRLGHHCRWSLQPKTTKEYTAAMMGTVGPATAMMGTVGPTTAMMGTVGPATAMMGTVGPATAMMGTVGPATAMMCTVGPATAMMGTVGPATAMMRTVGPATAMMRTVGPATAMMGTVGPTTAMMGTVGPATAMMGTVGPATAMMRTVGPATAMMGTVGPATAIMRTVGPATAMMGTVGPATAMMGTVGPATAMMGTVGPAQNYRRIHGCNDAHCWTSHCNDGHCWTSHCNDGHCWTSQCNDGHSWTSHCNDGHCWTSHCNDAHCWTSHCNDGHFWTSPKLQENTRLQWWALLDQPLQWWALLDQPLQ
ncbi:hypothetical protein ACOMHN_047485 [Nucella lapillus]